MRFIQMKHGMNSQAYSKFESRGLNRNAELSQLAVRNSLHGLGAYLHRIQGHAFSLAIGEAILGPQYSTVSLSSGHLESDTPQEITYSAFAMLLNPGGSVITKTDLKRASKGLGMSMETPRRPL